MKALVTIALLLLPLTATFAQVASSNSDARDAQPPATTNESPFSDLTIGPKSPFEDELNLYYYRRNSGGFMMGAGAAGTLSGFIATSTFLTLQGLTVFDKNTSFWCVLSSYIVTGISAGFMTWGFLDWYDNSNKYSDTIRLASNYYNMVDH